MNEPMLRFPATCPVCGTEQVTEMPMAALAEAFLTEEAIHLYAACHQQHWTASGIERGQIRQYLVTASINGVDQTGRE